MIEKKNTSDKYPPRTDEVYNFYCKNCDREVADLPYYHDHKESDGR